MGVNLESITFDPVQFEKELNAFDVLLKSTTDLLETNDIQPFFKKSKHLAAYMGTVFSEIGPATEMSFEYPFFGDFKGTKGFAKTFGDGHIKFFGVLVIGRSASLDSAKRSRLDWRTERVLIDSHPVSCLNFDDLHASLRDRFIVYRAAAKLETKKNKAKP